MKGASQFFLANVNLIGLVSPLWGNAVQILAFFLFPEPIPGRGFDEAGSSGALRPRPGFIRGAELKSD
jgi:hypothetical protein